MAQTSMTPKRNTAKLAFALLLAFPMFSLLQHFFAGGGAETGASALPAGALLVDVRTPSEFAEGSAPGAINVPLDALPARLEELRGERPIVVFCRSGQRSARAEALLSRAGFTQVVNGGTWQSVARALGR